MREEAVRASVAVDPPSAATRGAKQSGPAVFHLVTQVWGESYCRALCEYCLPALLAPGNLPALAAEWPAMFNVYTTEEDAAVLARSPAFARLSQLMPIDFTLIGDELSHEKYSAMSRIHRRVLRKAAQDDAAIVWLMPDTVWADGSLATVARMARRGKRAVMQAGIRVRKAAARPILDSRKSADGTLRITSRALVRIALEHMHPYYTAWFWDGPDFSRNPANIYWRVGTDGLVARCFHLHPLMLFPQRPVASFVSTFDDDLPLLSCPDYDSLHVVEDSDEIFHIDLADDDWCVQVPVKEKPPTPRFVAQYAFSCTNVHHRRFFGHGIRIHAEALDQEWTPVERQSARIASAVRRRLALGSALQTLLDRTFGLDRAALLARGAAGGVTWSDMPLATAWESGLSRRLGPNRIVANATRMRRFVFVRTLAWIFGRNVALLSLGIDPAERKRRRLILRRRRLRVRKRARKIVTVSVRRAVRRAARLSGSTRKQLARGSRRRTKRLRRWSALSLRRARRLRGHLAAMRVRRAPRRLARRVVHTCVRGLRAARLMCSTIIGR